MLKSSSGDLVDQLQAKLKELMERHDKQMKETRLEHENNKREMSELFEKSKTALI